MHAEIITIGEELLSGDSDIVDTNSIYITKSLRSIGLHVLWKTTVGDDEQRITDTIKLALGRVDVIITTGGLGPTVDDMTRQGVANAVDQKLELRQDLLDELAEKFARFGSRMSDNNRIQAMVPERATVIHNPVGTAPSFIVEHNGKVIISLPGVPREMKHLMEHAVVPYLREKVGATGIIKNRVLRTAGIGESLLDEQVGEFEKLTNPTVGLAAHSGQVDIRIAARAATEAEADALIADLEAKIRQKVGTHIFGVEKESLEAAFMKLLQQVGQKVALVEAGTGGLLRKRIEIQPDGPALLASAELFDTVEAFNSGANGDYKTLAEQSAAASHAKSGALAITVISDEHGTAIAVTDGTETRSRTYAYGGTDVGGPEWASGWGMSMAWHLLSAQQAGRG